MTNIDKDKQLSSKFSLVLFGAIASFTMAIANYVPFFSLQSVQASEASTVVTKQKQAELGVAKLVGTYRVVFTPEFLANSKKSGVQSISGQWTIKPNGIFEAFVYTIVASGKSQTIKTSGRVSVVNGKVFSQIETINGKKPAKLPPTQSYTLLPDGKTIQADRQPVKLVRL
ncbi:MAG: hypothetical protein DCF19_09485 [Pseudanabaena frigida]|uniref:Uncharacterized protein n=1 Tax=Pseudanabaena frigida TaxID=945775 RepID=A0A2W4WHI8_9CYAN|nr:MAG: hypothetical protein DCF19_09485 [Pseudanabaena frigida]